MITFPLEEPKFPTCPDAPFTEPPQCMPDFFKHKDTVQAYRNYYMGAKRNIAKWAHSEKPEWFE